MKLRIVPLSTVMLVAMLVLAACGGATTPASDEETSPASGPTEVSTEVPAEETPVQHITPTGEASGETEVPAGSVEERVVQYVAGETGVAPEVISIVSQE